MSSYSKFLPENFFSKSTIVLIAGRDKYPIIMADRIRELGLNLKLIAFKEETDSSLIQSFSPNDVVVIKVGQLGKMLKILQKFEAKYALMAGQITPKKLFRGLHPDIKAIRILNSLKEKNAESIFGAIATEMEEIGVQLLDARSFMDEQMATHGLMTTGKIKEEHAVLAHGIKIAKEIARLDIGQGVVVRKGTVIAVEGFEGTNEMIARAGELANGKLLFVKTVKSNQDYRFDVPVFGLTTLEYARKAGVETIALESNRVIVLNRDEVISKARQFKIQIYGYRADEFTNN